MKNIDLSVTRRSNPKGTLYKNDLFIYQGNWKDENPSQFFRLDILSICFVEKGVHRLILNSKDYEVREGDVLICRANDIMSGLSYSDDFHCTFIYASMDIVSCYMDSLTFRRYMELVGYSPILHITENQRMLCRKYSELLKMNKVTFDGKNEESMLMIGKAMIIDIFNMLPKEIDYSVDAAGMTRPRQIYRDFINLLSATPHKNRDIVYYADRLSISPKYLSYVCKQESGKTAKDWLREYIMNYYCPLKNLSRYKIRADSICRIQP